MTNKLKFQKKQAGLTLIEVMSSLAILAIVIGGALALFSSASTAQTSTQLRTDVNSIKTSVEYLFANQNTFGTGSLNPLLISTKRVPQTMSISGIAGITTSQQGVVDVDAFGTSFVIKVGSVPVDVCIALLASQTQWLSIQRDGGALLTSFPVSSATAAAQCSGFGPGLSFRAS